MDKELLELAAKAAGIDGRYASLDEFPDWMTCHDGEGIYFTSSQTWNPLTNDGDALRLAVKLNLDITHSWSIVYGDDKYPMASIHVSYNNRTFVYELKEADPYAATRRAIVRAAAEIGRAM